MRDVLTTSLSGVPLLPSPYVPEGTMYRSPAGIHFHQRASVRGKRRRPHGRGRPCPRRWKVRVVTYRPDFDRLVEASRDHS